MFQIQRVSAAVSVSRVLLVGLASAVVAPRALRADDVYDLQRGLPLEVEDTKTADPGSVSLQGTAQYEHTDAGRDRVTLEPQIQYGLVQDVHVQLSAPFMMGDADKGGSGDVQLGVVYNFLKEDEARPWVPALAVLGQLDLPTGRDSDGLDTTLRLIATKAVTRASSEDQVHFNLEWEHNAAREDDERANRFSWILGYSRRLSKQTVLVADFVREQQGDEGLESNLIELGVLHQLSEKLTAAAGVGVGIGDDSPDVRLQIGLQWSF